MDFRLGEYSESNKPDMYMLENTWIVYYTKDSLSGTLVSLKQGDYTVEKINFGASISSLFMCYLPTDDSIPG